MSPFVSSDFIRQEEAGIDFLAVTAAMLRAPLAVPTNGTIHKRTLRRAPCFLLRVWLLQTPRKSKYPATVEASRMIPSISRHAWTASRGSIRCSVNRSSALN